MRTSSILATAILVIVLLGPAWAQRGPLPPPLIKEGVTEKISEHVYVIPDGEVLLVPNVGIIVGTRGVFVVDSGLGTRNGQTIMREVAKVSKGGELYLASTHFHPEHDLGAGGFPATAKMLRSRDQQADITSPVSRPPNCSRASRRRQPSCSKGRSSGRPISCSTKS